MTPEEQNKPAAGSEHSPDAGATASVGGAQDAEQAAALDRAAQSPQGQASSPATDSRTEEARIQLPLKPGPKPVARPAPLTNPGAAKPATPLKPTGEKPPPPTPPPFEAEPSFPISMIRRPDAAAVDGRSPTLCAGELSEDFESALAGVLLSPRRTPIARRIFQRIERMVPASARRAPHFSQTRRTVAFDGFRTRLHDEKLERDRRYGTVYTVSEEVNAFLVRLEFPRRMPNSSLKQTWELPDEMPDYDYTLHLADNVLSVQAGLRSEACRRVSYVSPSFPTDFLTRIEFDVPVAAFKQRLRDKVLEVIVFKRFGVGRPSTTTADDRHQR